MMSGLILFLQLTVLGFVEKIGLEVGRVYLEPESINGKEVNLFFTSQKFYNILCGEIPIGYWDAKRELTTRRLNWKSIYLGVKLKWYPWEECIYFSGGIDLYHVWMEDELLPINYVRNLKENGLSLSPLNAGAEFLVSDNFWVGVKIGVSCLLSHLSHMEREVSEHNFPMYYTKINITYER